MTEGEVQAEMCDRKYSVLIADDDFRIGMLIKTLIQWDEFGLECASIVSNGQDAYRLISNGDIDIAITDIQMPLMSGLDLIAGIKEKGIRTRFIVISGYKDFEYAHRALQYEVSSYLLKPIDADELNDTLRKMTGELRSENRQKTQEKEMVKFVAASQQIIRRDLLNSMIDRKLVLAPASVEALQKEYGVNLTATAYVGIDVKLDYIDFQKITKERDLITTEKVIGIFNAIFKELVQEILICERPYLHIMGLLIFDREKSKEIKGSINTLLTELQHYLLGFEQYKVTVGIGEEAEQIADAAQTLSRAEFAIANRMDAGTERLIYAGKLQRVQADTAKICERLMDCYQAALANYAVDEFESCLDAIFHDIEQIENIDNAEYYRAARQLCRWFFMQEGSHSEAPLRLEQQLLEWIEHSNTLPALRNTVKQALCEQLRVHIATMQARPIKPIRQAKEYVIEHSSEKIVLEEIAALVELNPAYFSSLFKKETGMNFSDYLISTRMDSAKKLLTGTNETIAAIADRIGYKDVRYFSKLFTKTIGVKPAVYRRLYS
jgi:two-component system response regulator YesN